MNIFLDMEMTGLQQDTSMISIGMVSENGRTFYAECMDYNKFQLTPWLKKNVINNLTLTPSPEGVATAWGNIMGPEFSLVADHAAVSRMAAEWLKQFGKVQIWSDVYAYDWVLFCEMFPFEVDSAERLPKHISYIPLDLATLFLAKDMDPDTNRIEFAIPDKDARIHYELLKHNALNDARIIKHCYEKLMKINPLPLPK